MDNVTNVTPEQSKRAWQIFNMVCQIAMSIMTLIFGPDSNRLKV